MKSSDGSVVYSSEIPDSEIDNFIDTNFDNKTLIFVDGAFSNKGRSGVGVYIPTLKIEISKRISDNLSAYTSELVAIETAMEVILNKNIFNTVILSDSMNVLNYLKINCIEHNTRVAFVLHTILINPGRFNFA